MSTAQNAAKPARGGLATLQSKLDTGSIAGRPPRWYLTGWRLGVLVLILALIYPFVVPDQSLVIAAISVGIYVLLALGLNIVVGYAGLLDLGYVAFFVIGSYTAAVLTGGTMTNFSGQPISVPKLSFWLVLPLGALFAGIFGVLLGAPTLRLRGDYLAIVTLGFGAIVPIAFQFTPFFFGSFGMSALAPDDIGPVTFSDPLNRSWFYYLTLAVVVVIVLAVVSLRDSSLGRAWIAIREDETAASAAGINLVRTKLLAFGLGAVIGGIGGVLNASFNLTVNPGDFNFNVSITILVMIVLGGLGSIPGVIIGAVILRFLDVYLLQQITSVVHGSPLVADPGTPLHFLADVNFDTAKYLIYGLVLLAMVLFRPQGIIPNVRRQRELAGIGAAVEGTSAVGLLAREEAGIDETGAASEDATSFVGLGSDAQGREE